MILGYSRQNGSYYAGGYASWLAPALAFAQAVRALISRVSTALHAGIG